MRDGEKLWKGALAGAVAGLAASWTMNQFQALWSKVQDGGSGGEDEDATMKVANLASEKVLHRELTKEEKKKAGPYFHYGFGTVVGALYGVLAEEFPAATAGFGTVYATAVFLIGDEGAVPALKLSGKPSEYPLSSHLEAFASHLVYGASAESVRRGIRAALGEDNLRQAKRGLRKAKETVQNTAENLSSGVHWEVEACTELPRTVRKAAQKINESANKARDIGKAARRRWAEAA
ncbi:MAG: DUF1440 domain-containing protein [Acidobacteriaceae bacterium]